MQLVVANGHTVLIDEWNYPLVVQFHWRAYRFGRNIYYATTRINGKTAYMHRVIAGNPDEMEVDHWSGNGLDNRECNLRLATHQQNTANRRLSVNNTSGFPGVTLAKGNRKKPWVAQSKHHGKRVYLGCYATPEEASRVREDWFRRIHGRFAPSATEGSS